jgi:spore coat protein U-like protein
MTRIFLLAALLLAWLSAECRAGTATANLSVNITITAGCTVTGNTLSFGSQSILAANIDQSTTIGVTCTNTTAYNVGLGVGANGASVTARKMLGGASNTEYVNYSLYSDAARTINLGQTIGTDTVTGTGNGAVQTLTIYGRVPPQTTGSAGSYTDTVLITVTF